MLWIVECQANRWEMAQAIVEAGGSSMEEKADLSSAVRTSAARTFVRERRSYATATPSPAWRTPPPKAWVKAEVDAERAGMLFAALTV